MMHLKNSIGLSKEKNQTNKQTNKTKKRPKKREKYDDKKVKVEKVY
jgi:hypothetical protein